MSQKKSLGKSAVVLMLAKVITLCITTVSTAIISHCRSLEEYGTYSSIMLVVTLAVSLFSLGLPNSVNYFVARADDEAEKRDFLSQFYTLNTIMSLLTGIVLVVATPVIVSYFDGNEYIKSFIYVLALMPFIKIISSSVENLYVVYNKATHLMIYRLLHSIVIVVIALCMYVFKWSFNKYMVIYIVAECIFSVIIYVIAYRLSGGIKPKFEFKFIKIILAFSIPLGLATVVGTLNIELDKLLIGKVMSTEDLAIYTNAAKEMPVSFIASAFTAVLMPALVRLLKEKKNEEAVSLWNSATTLSFAVMSLFAAGLFVFAPEVIVVLYSAKYLPGVWVFRIYNLVLLLRCTYFGMILNSIGKTKFILYSSIASLLLNCVLNLLFYKLFGFIGPAIATIISITVIQIAQLVATTKTINISFSKIFPWKKAGILLLLNIVIGGMFAAVRPLILNSSSEIRNIIVALIMGAVWSIIYFAITGKMLLKDWKKLNSK